MALSAAAIAALAEARRFLAEPGAICYVMTTRTGRRLTLYPEDATGNPDDEAFAALIIQRAIAAG